MFDGPSPLVTVCKDIGKEAEAIRTWIANQLREGCQPHEIGVFVRSEAELKRSRAALKIVGARSIELSDRVEVEDGSVAISIPKGSTRRMHGLENPATLWSRPDRTRRQRCAWQTQR